MSRWGIVQLFAPGGGGGGATPPNLFHFALTPGSAAAYWWPDVSGTAGSIVPSSQVLMMEASGFADAQGVIANATDPAAFTVLFRTNGANAIPITWTLSYAVSRAGVSGVPAAFTEAIADVTAPLGDTLVAATFAVTPGNILAGDVVFIRVARGADANPNKAIVVAGTLG